MTSTRNTARSARVRGGSQGLVGVVGEGPRAGAVGEARWSHEGPVEVAGGVDGVLLQFVARYLAAEGADRPGDRPGTASWFLVRRVAHPVAQLADAADAVAAGDYRVHVPHTGFSSEIVRLSDAFDHMATRLADTETTRTRMLADLAHELRTPLATLEAYIDGMEDRVVPTEAQSWQTMRDQVARLRRLATDLREAAAAEEHALGLVLEPADAGQLAETAVAAARPRYQTKGVALELDIPDASVEVHADEERMQQVLGNLLDNARRHTPQADTSPSR